MRDHTIIIHTSQNGSGGAKVSLHKSMLKSALTVRMDSSNLLEQDTNNRSWNTVIIGKADAGCKWNRSMHTSGINKENAAAWVTLAAPSHREYH